MDLVATSFFGMTDCNNSNSEVLFCYVLTLEITALPLLSWKSDLWEKEPLKGDWKVPGLRGLRRKKERRERNELVKYMEKGH